MVVPREEDLLQQVFGETAHNPESNLDLRMPNPSPLPIPSPMRQQQVPTPVHLKDSSVTVAPSHYPASLSPSTWSSQSSLSSHISAMSTGPHQTQVMLAHPYQRPNHPATMPVHPQIAQANIRANQSPVAPPRAGQRKHSINAGGTGKSQSTAPSANRKGSLPLSKDRRQAIYTIQNSLPSVPHYVPSTTGKNSPTPSSTNSTLKNEPSNDSVFAVYEPILDRALVRGSVKDNRRLEKDPDGRVYEVVQTRVVESKIGDNKIVSNEKKDPGTHVGRKSSVGGEAEAKRVRVQSLSPPRLRVDQAHMRSASVNTRQDGPKLIRDGTIHGSHQSLRSTKAEAITQSGNRLNRARRSCTEPITWSSDHYQSNDKTQEVIDRIKKNVERKEEFLKRPNQPIWLPASKAPIVHRDYHVNPQRFPKPLWPPPGAQTPPSPGAITKALSFIIAPKQDHPQLRRVKSEIEHRTPPGQILRGRSGSVPTEGSQDKNETLLTDDESHFSDDSGSITPRALVGNSVPKPYTGNTNDPNVQRYGKSFISTLSRIQENIPIPEMGSTSSLSSQGRQGSRKDDTSQSCTPFGTPSGSQTSLNSGSVRSIPLAWVGDNERIKQLQIVSRRAKQFESNQVEKDHGKSAFHRFELSRLSQRSKVPNVAQRKQEFELKDGEQPHGFDFEFGTHYTNTPRQRKSVELARSHHVAYELSPSPPKVFRSFSDGGRIFPVGRHLYSPTPDDFASLQHNASDSPNGPRVSMNRTIPVGGPHIHCEPPRYGAHRPQSDSDVLERERSNSVCSQNSVASLWSTQSMEETGSARSKTVARQNSYLSALRSPLAVATPSASAGASTGEMGVVTSASTPTVSTTSAPTTTTSTSATTPTNAASMVSRRNKHTYDDESERLVRRVSYLKATSGERMYSDSDLDSDIDDVTIERGDGVELVRVVGGVVATPSTPSGPLCVGDLPSPASLHSAVVRQGTLNVKLTIVDGKKAGDRSWKTVWAVVQGRALIFYKDRQHALQTPLGVEEQISLRGSEVDVARDYTKRRNVLRLATPGGSQLLLQAETPPEMLAWLSTLQDNCTIQEGETGSKTPMNNNVSPQSSNKGMRKLTSLRTRSPTGQSPSTKTRKPSSIESNSSPKSKTWRGHLVRPFMKKMQGSPAVTPTTPLPEGATIGVCLEDCPQSPDNEFVPLLICLCISVIETRGLQTQGIYRIPGNKAAVTHLTEMINKGPKAIDYNDPRWSDVNVISSMLKQFFQKLPDPLFTCDLYPHFIEASKIEDPSQRMMELKRFVHELPDHHYETLRFLMMHLSHIVSQSEFNKMDVRNLAIVFGPTLVRSGDDNMVTMVTDMSHQCRIVETLISQAAWFFSEEDGEDSGPPIPDSSDVQSPSGDMSHIEHHETPSSQAMLLHNINKVEGNVKVDLKKDIVSSIISAANRKVHKVKYKKNLEDKAIDESKCNNDKEGGFEERDIDKEAELRKNRLLAKQMESMVELPDPKPMSERKISNMSMMSVQSHASGVSSASQNSVGLDRTSNSEHSKPSGVKGDDEGRLFCVVKSDDVGASTTSLSSSTSTLTSMPTSQPSSQLAPESINLLGDEVAIRSYAGLSASTQERIRRFEMETRAMLHRDLTKHRRETERRDLERRRLEELWQRAKQDMESEDILDQLADNPTEVVRKISDYSWRMQGLSESMGGERGSLASQGSSNSSQAALISAALSHHHPLSNTSLTPTTNVSTQVSNTTTTTCSSSQLPLIQIDNAPTTMACDTSTLTKHGLTQQQSLSWLDYNTASPHSTLGSTTSSNSSGYGSLTRSSDYHQDVEDKADDMSCHTDNKSLIVPPQSPQPPPKSPARTKKKKSNNKGTGIMFGLTSSSSSPSLFPSMVQGAAELTPTRKIGQTVIYPESPRPPPHARGLSTQSRPAQVTASSSSSLTPHPNTAHQGRQKDSVLHHILPSRLYYHSPRPLRRGSSAENVTQPVNIPQSPCSSSSSIFDTQRVVNNGTLKRARAGRDQILNGPEMGMARCSSLDSLRDGSQAPPDDGSDLLSAITATFEEKMRSLQESPLGLVTTAGSDESIDHPDQSPDADQSQNNVPRVKTECRLYRDPSLHRRRTNNRNSSSTSGTSTSVNNSVTTANSKVEDPGLSNKYAEEENKATEEPKREAKVKRSDSLTKSEKTENNMKEKTEKRARELKRTDTQESLNEKRPKEMKRSDMQGANGRSKDLTRKSETKETGGSAKRNSEVRSRKHNVKELKEKFEQNTGPQNNASPMKPSNNNTTNNNKGSKSGMRRTGYRGQIKRRHTVGGTKDLAKWAWLQSGEVARNNPRATRLSAWERLQPLVADERLNTDRSLEAWLAHERIRTSSPDLSRPQQLVLPCDVDDKENIHRRRSVQEATLNPLYPVLESHV